MGVTPEEMEAVIRSAIPITYLQILDESSGCGENYSVVIVSEVRIAHASSYCVIGGCRDVYSI